ncbi:MAG: HD domain-containing protein [Acidobacteriota bacterium]
MGEKSEAFPLRVAAIDIGSNAIRFFAAEFADPDSHAVLEAERSSVRLGHGVFLTGKLTREAMDAAVGTIAEFKERMARLGVTKSRAVATSAVREATNGERFLARVKKETGIQIEMISGSEEARLVHLAVRNRVAMGKKQWLLVDLGGGSVEVSLADHDAILWSESHTMGSVRLLEELADVGEEPGRFRRLLEEYVSTLRLPSVAEYRRPAGLIATGGNIDALARLSAVRQGPGGSLAIPLAGLRAAIARLSGLSFRQRVDELGLREDRADVIVPAALVYERLAVLAGVEEIHAPGVGVREGVALDLADEAGTARSYRDRQLQQVTAGAVALGRHYMFDEGHGEHVARLALSLFDQLRKLHGLGDADRRLLLAAAILHDIGSYVSYKRHHKHSLYLISNSELPGFTPKDMTLVANIARYHRKSEPASDHDAFVALEPRDQRRVEGLASLLRMADALDREHSRKVDSVRAQVKNKRLVLHIDGRGDLLLEKWALERKSDFFRRVYGLAVVVETTGESA